MRSRRIILGVLVSLMAFSAPPAAAQSPSPQAPTVPMCEDVPALDLTSAPFRETPVYVGNEQPISALRMWAKQHPGFEDLWIDRDHLGWVVLAFSQDAAARQAELEQALPDAGAVVVGVDWTRQELDDLHQKAMEQPRGLLTGFGTDITRGVGVLEVGLLEPDKVAEVRRRFAGDRVCISGIDPASVPAPGPQPRDGDGWRLLGHARVGPPYRTGIAADRASLRTLWKRIGIPGRAPAVDFRNEVAIWFGAVYGSTCPGLRMDDVVVDPDAALIHPLLVNRGAMIHGCTDDARGHAFVVALERDRLPAPPFRIQLSADDPPGGAFKEITEVSADLRIPGSVPGRGEVRSIRPPQDQRYLRSGDIMEVGFPADYLADARCGLEWIGRVNDIWWRTEVPAGAHAGWVPETWLPAVREDGTLPVQLLLLSTEVSDLDPVDDADLADRPRLEVTAEGATVVYHATMEAPPACP